MKTDSKPATKADIQELKGDIGKLMEAVSHLYDADETWKDEILESNERWKDEILTANERWKNDLTRHFNLAFETHGRDIFDALGDHDEPLRDVQRRHRLRLNRLEACVGIND
ncbi:MAG: hypothetical protein KDA93_01565 [Planctomycetaceae bacterium]|nr:hypothetical protein [Planctomycetaceae bacterium]